MTVDTLFRPRARAGSAAVSASARHDRGIVLLLIVMMGLVFAPVIGVHAVAALGVPAVSAMPAEGASAAAPTVRSPG